MACAKLKRVFKMVLGEWREVTVCPPSRRRAASRVTRARAQRLWVGAVFLAKDSGQIKGDDE